MVLDPVSPTNAEVSALDRAHVFHSWSAQRLINPVPIAGGAGSEFWDHDGNRWLDFSSQLVNLNLGHQHPKVIAAIVEQAERLCTVAPSFANQTRNEAARLIAAHAPEGLDRVFFTNGGAEANENAIRLARAHTGRAKVLATYRSYHGATAATMALTGEPRRWGSEPAIPGVVHFIGPYPYRSSFGATTDQEEADRAIAHLAEVIQYEGPELVAAVILETVVGTNGVLLPPADYLPRVRELCDANGILLILDEVMVGFGRTGEWFAADHWQVAPDLLCFAKGVNSGYVPLGGVVMTEAIAETFSERAYQGGLTYSGHPLACAAAVGAIRAMEDDEVIEHAAHIGADVLGPGLRELAARHASVGEVRGLGCFFALELVKDPVTREGLVPFNASGDSAKPMVEVVNACKSRGLWPFAHFNRIHMAPPLIVTDAEVGRALAILDEALAVADGFLG
ncbi:MAG: aspartate aminotransferase family protein [Acidimicrobiales bacterium]